MYFVCKKKKYSYLLHILLKDAELQTLVQADFAVLPDVFQLSLVVQHLVDDVQDVVHRLRVVGRCRQRIGAAWGQGSLQLVQQSFSVLAHLGGDIFFFFIYRVLDLYFSIKASAALPQSTPP